MLPLGGCGFPIRPADERFVFRAGVRAARIDVPILNRGGQSGNQRLPFFFCSHLEAVLLLDLARAVGQRLALVKRDAGDLKELEDA